MNTVTLSDLSLVVPEQLLVGAALLLMLLARRLQQGRVAVLVTVATALAAGFAATQGSVPRSGFAGMILLDDYARFFKVLIAAALALSALLSMKGPTERQPRQAEYHVLLLLASTGMMLAVSAQDLLTLYLALELMTLCSYTLVGIAVERPTANEAAIKYFLLGSLASALFLYGISLSYGLTGGTGFDVLAAGIAENGLRQDPMFLLALGLLAAGLSFKIAAVPFHAWAPDAYQGSTAPVAAFLAAASKAAGLAAMGRVCLAVFDADVQILSVYLAGLAGLSIAVGSILALGQSDLKRLLAYSSITHAGYALLGLVAGTAAGVSATMTYAFYYVFMTIGTFGVVIALGERGETVDGYRGLASQRPLTALLMMLFMLALTGIPPTSGFAAKFVVITHAVSAGHVVLAVIAVVCSVITAFIYMRVVVLMFMQEPTEPVPNRLPLALSTALAAAALVTLLGGIFPASLTPWVVSP